MKGKTERSLSPVFTATASDEHGPHGKLKKDPRAPAASHFITIGSVWNTLIHTRTDAWTRLFMAEMISHPGPPRYTKRKIITKLGESW